MVFLEMTCAFFDASILVLYLKLFHSRGACINYKHSEQFRNQLALEASAMAIYTLNSIAHDRFHLTALQYKLVQSLESESIA